MERPKTHRLKPVLLTPLRISESGFKFAEAPLEFPLLLRFFAGLEEGRASRGGFGNPGRIGRARGGSVREDIRLAPQARTG